MLAHSLLMKNREREREREGWLGTCLILLPHMPALSMTSLTRAAEHIGNGSSDGGVFKIFKCRFSTKKKRNRVRTCGMNTL